jgi:response regulator NasT
LARFHDVQQLRRRVHELGETLEARKAIERAKGLLMQRLSLSEHDAYEYIHTRARDRRVRMKVIADEVLAGEHATTA